MKLYGRRDEDREDCASVYGEGGGEKWKPAAEANADWQVNDVICREAPCTPYLAPISK
jgi:hypothetical protein